MYLRELHTNPLALAARLLIQEGILSHEIRHILEPEHLNPGSFLDHSFLALGFIYFLSLWLGTLIHGLFIQINPLKSVWEACSLSSVEHSAVNSQSLSSIYVCKFRLYLCYSWCFGASFIYSQIQFCSYEKLRFQNLSSISVSWSFLFC